MKITLYGKNLDLTLAIKSFSHKKISAISKFLSPKDDSLAEARVELAKPSKHHKTGPIFYAEINLKIGRDMFRAVSENVNLYVAIDKAIEELEGQVKRKKEKLITKSRRQK